MKKLRYILFTGSFMGLGIIPLFSQEKKADLSLNLSYINRNNHLQYLQVSAKSKVKGKFQPVPGLAVNFYISDEQTKNNLGKATTNDKGLAVLFIPPSAKEEWTKSESNQFLAKTDATSAHDSTTTTAEVTKSKINIDTAADRKIIATMLALHKGKWTPVSGVDLVLAVKRMGSDLNVDQNPTHTTDSLGQAQVDYTLADLPGDSAGNIILVAKVDENDLYGTVTSEKSVPWGIRKKYVSDFGKRSLFARRGRGPLWLGFMASFIALSVWAVIFYLLFQIRRLRKLANE
jgi:hypothetical protein